MQRHADTNTGTLTSKVGEELAVPDTCIEGIKKGQLGRMDKAAVLTTERLWVRDLARALCVSFGKILYPYFLCPPSSI